MEYKCNQCFDSGLLQTNNALDYIPELRKCAIKCPCQTDQPNPAIELCGESAKKHSKAISSFFDKKTKAPQPKPSEKMPRVTHRQQMSGRDLATELFHSWANLPCYEKIDEDMAISLIRIFGDKFAEHTAAIAEKEKLIEALEAGYRKLLSKLQSNLEADSDDSCFDVQLIRICDEALAASAKGV